MLASKRFNLSGERRMTIRGTTTAVDRILACLPYVLPIADSLIFAVAFVTLLPITAPVIGPVIALGLLYQGITGMVLGQYSSLLIFFALYLLVVRNQKINHFIRFHTMQALMIGICISLVTLLFQLINLPIDLLLSSNSPLGLAAPILFAALFVVVAGCYLYSIFCAVQGKYAEIPAISEAAYAQTRD
jgi:uncharacterized membrane protein